LLDKKFPVPKGQIPTSDIVKSYIGLLALGKSDFDAIEAFRKDRFFRQALGIGTVPSSAWLRQRMEMLAVALREETDAYSVRLLRNAEAPVTAMNGFVCLDFDTFVMDNSGTKKECVDRTYQGVDGYTPIAAYLGNEGWCLALELRPGSQHSALETHYFLERVLPRAHELAPAGLPVLSRSDSGFDLGSELLFQQDDEKRAWALEGRTFEYLVKWNPRKQSMDDWAARATKADAWVEARPGKRVALLDLTVKRSWEKEKRDFRLVVRLIERTVDPKGARCCCFPITSWRAGGPASKPIQRLGVVLKEQEAKRHGEAPTKKRPDPASKRHRWQAGREGCALKSAQMRTYLDNAPKLRVLPTSHPEKDEKRGKNRQGIVPIF
jgi:hypothetical protein